MTHKTRIITSVDCLLASCWRKLSLEERVHARGLQHFISALPDNTKSTRRFSNSAPTL